MNKYNPAGTTSKYNPGATVKPEVPFDATAFGITANTIKGFFPAALDLGKEILQGTARNFASTGATILNTVFPQYAQNITRENTNPQLFDFLYGKDTKSVEDIGTRIVQGEETIKNSPFAQRLGLDKYAGPLSFAGVVGSTALDLTPFGGNAKRVTQALVKETTEEGAAKILKSLKIPDEIAQRFSPELAAAKSEAEVDDIMETLRATHGLQQITERAATAAPEEIAKLEKAINGEDFTPHLKFDRDGKPLAYTAKEQAIRDAAPVQPQIMEIVSPKLLQAASKDWAEGFAPKFQELFDRGIQITDQLKTTKSSSQKGILRSQLDSIVAQQDELEGEFVRKWREAGGLPENIPQTRGMDIAPAFENVATESVKRRASQMQRFEEILQEAQDKGWKLERFLKAADEVYPVEDPSVRTDLTTVFNKLFNRAGYTPTSRELSQATQGLELSRARYQSIGKVLEGKFQTPASMLTQLPQDELRSVRNLIDDKIKTVKDRVHFFDYLATPEFVLEKLGLGREAKLLQKAKDGYAKELPAEIEKITNWRKEVGTSDEVSTRIFRWLDGNPTQPTLPANELKVATEIKAYLAGWADRLDLPHWKRIANYITHIFEPDLLKKEFDDDLARLITDKTPGSVYDPFLEKRLGQMGYVEDTWRALDAYTKRAVRKANFDPALEQLSRAAEKLDLNSEKYVMRLAGRVNLRPTEIDNLFDNFLKSIPGIGYRLGQRPVANLTQSVRRMYYRGTLGLNIGSAMRNLTQGANTYAKLGERYTITGYMKVFTKLLTRNLDELKNVGVLEDNFIQDRKIGVYKNMLQTLDKGLWVFFDTAEKINRGAAYFGAKSKAINKGLSEREAIDYAKRIVRETQFAFGNVDSPVALSSDFAKTIGQLQTFNVKQIEFLSRMAKNKEFAGLVRWTIGSLAMVYSFGKLFGMKPEQLIPSIGLGNSPFISGISGAIGSVNPANTESEQEDARKQLMRSLTSLIPAGAQLRKSIEGYQAAEAGKDVTPTGRERFKIQTDSDKIRAVIFGKSSLPQAQEYYERVLNPSSAKSSGGSRYNQ